jgi:hypothetical protein
MNTLTLESVEEAFGKWRAKRSQSDSIPAELWEMALGLYPQHTRSTICAKLRLSGGQFKSRLEEGSSESVNGFVLAYKDESSPRSVAGPEVKLTIQGKERTLMLCVSLDALGQLVPHLGALL